MADRHRGKFVGGWVSQEVFDRFEDMSVMAGMTKTRTLEKLIMGRAIQDKSYVKAVNEIARLGGLMKHKASGDRDIYQLGQQLLKIAREMREGPCRQSSPSE